MAWAPCEPPAGQAAKAKRMRGEDGQLGSLLHPTPAFWVNGGLTCLELSSDYLSTSITPISKREPEQRSTLSPDISRALNYLGSTRWLFYHFAEHAIN